MQYFLKNTAKYIIMIKMKSFNIFKFHKFERKISHEFRKKLPLCSHLRQVQKTHIIGSPVDIR